MKKRIISVILIFCLLAGLVMSRDITVKAEDSCLDAITPGLEYMSDEMAQSYIGFIYNVRADMVTDEQKSMNNIFNYLTGRLEKGSDEYVFSQIAYMLTADKFINNHITEGNKISQITTENLINILTEYVGGEDALSNAAVNKALGNVEGTIKQIMYYVFEYDDSSFFQKLDTVMSGYNTVMDVKGKVEDFLTAVEAVVNGYLLVVSSNSAKGYNYYSQYVMFRDFYEIDPRIMDIGLTFCNIANISEVDGITIFLDKIGFGNSWTNKDVQRILRIFGEFRYHSGLESQGKSQPTEATGVSFAVDEYTIFFNYILTNPAVAYPTIANGTVVSYSSGDTSIATVDADGRITPVSPGTVKIYAETESGLSNNCTVHILPFTASNSNGQYTITSYVGNGGVVEVPSKVVDKTVVAIAPSAFEDCHNITNVVIQEGVKEIGDRAFYNCDLLTNVTIPDSVTSIGGNAFFQCRELTSVTLPNNITSIEEQTFTYCESLTSVIIPDGVTSIGRSAFSYCYSLRDLDIPDSVTNIGMYAFNSCENIVNITLPNSVTRIEKYAFMGCSSLTSIVIPDGVTAINDSVFRFCISLESVSLPVGVKNICEGAFYNCLALTSVNIPKTVTSIGDTAFSSCTSLESITVDVENGLYSSQDGVLFNKDKSILILYPINKEGSIYTIPDSVVSIGQSAFSLNKSLTGIGIPDGVAEIGWSAFSQCDLLKNVTIPDSVVSIGEYAFYQCRELTSITLSNNITSISENTFEYCKSLTSVVIPDGVTSINKSAFAFCTSLESVEIPDSVTNIDDSAFSNCKLLASISIPSRVTNIGGGAFTNCGLTSIVIPDGVTQIKGSTFWGCQSLTSITIPDSVTSIGDRAFYNCESLIIYCNVGNVSDLLTGTEYKHKCFGDFDGDKALSDFDTAKMRESLVGILDENYDETVADYNRDKEFDVRDLVRLKKALVK